MPVSLDDTDLAILKSLMQDGRKSFRAISRETGVSTPTVKARFERLVNMGLIKSVRPEIDVTKIDASRRSELGAAVTSGSRHRRHFLDVKVGDNLQVKVICEFCGGPIHDKPRVLKFANFQRFFCCMSCKNGYREKHGGRIQSVVEKYRHEQKKKGK